jgi:type I restriction enzyme S subunit
MQVLIKDVVDKIIDYRGKTPKKLGSDWAVSGVPAISAKNIKHGLIVREDTIRYLDEATYQKWMKEKVAAGDVIMTSEAPLGETYYLKDSSPLVLSQRLFALRTKPEKLDSRYFYLYTKTRDFRKILETFGTGATVSGIRQQLLWQIPLEIPDIDYQKKVADLATRYDSLIENNLTRITILEDIARLLYDHYFNSTAADDWDVRKLSDLCDTPRDAVMPSQLNASTPYIGLEHIPRRSLAFPSVGKINGVQSLKLRFSKGDILFGKIRPYFHKVAPAPIDGVASSDTIIIRPKSRDLYAIVLMTVFSDAFIAQAVQSSNGTKMPRANWGVLAKQEVHVPPEHTLERFNGALLPILDLMQTLTQKNEVLRNSRKLLLPRLMSGEVKA